MSAPGELDRFFAKIPDDVVGVCRRLRVKGKRGWVVGGCVRDLLLGRDAKDWDIATDALPEEVTRFFAKVIPTGIKHGTVTVLVRGQHFEVTTLRGEGDYRDGRRPEEVVFLNEIVDDLARRDFTINAIAIDPIERQLVDPFHGQRDLGAGVVRAVGKPAERFAEDGLRILRGARFAATLGFSIEGDTLRAMAARRSLDTLAKVSAERIHDEWLKSMAASKPSIAFEVMREVGVMRLTCPELGDLVNVPQSPSSDVWTHSMATLDACADDRILRVAALLHDVGKAHTAPPDFEDHDRIGADVADSILRRLKFSNDDRERVVATIRHHLPGYHERWSDADVRRWIRRVGSQRIEDVIALARADAMASGHPGFSGHEPALRALDELETRARASLDAGAALGTRDLQLSGKDLMTDLGMPPGPRIGEVLRALVEVVTDDPSANERGRLLDEARKLLVEERS